MQCTRVGSRGQSPSCLDSNSRGGASALAAPPMITLDQYCRSIYLVIMSRPAAAAASMWYYSTQSAIFHDRMPLAAAAGECITMLWQLIMRPILHQSSYYCTSCNPLVLQSLTGAEPVPPTHAYLTALVRHHGNWRQHTTRTPVAIDIIY